MVIQLRLKNFRQYKDQIIHFKPHFTLIKGRNNSGKTTIFYGISYNLFGFIQGFKNLRQIAQYGKNYFGTESIITRDNKIYKIQRVHKLSKKNSRCIFTLSEICEDGEKIILSSDYQDKLEHFNKKIVEILGFSRKFFEFAIFYKQGELLPILDGKRSIDQILGINAFVELNRAISSRIKELEKEEIKLSVIIDEIINLKEEQNQNLEELRNYRDSLRHYEENIKNWERYIQKYNGLEIGTLNNEMRNLFYLLLSIKGEIIKFQGKIEEVDNIYTIDFKSIEEKGIESFDEQISKLFHEIEIINIEIKNKQEEINEYIKLIGKLQEQKGDLSGILKRKKKIVDQALCEYCGAAISKDKIGAEISNSEKKTNEISLEIQFAKDRKKKIENEVNNLIKTQQECNFKIKNIQSTRERYLSITAKKSNLDEKLKRLNTNLGTNVLELHEKIKKLLKNMKILNNYNLYWSLETLNDKFSSVKRDPMKIEILSERFSKISSKISGSKRQAKSDIDYYQRNLIEYTKIVNPLKEKIERYKKRITDLNLQIEIIRKQQKKIELYKDIIFRNIRILKKIRKQALNRLDQLLKEYYNLLSDQEEFEDIRINPEDYSVGVKVKNQDIYFPVSIYQGGGQKLILSLAYNLSLGSIFRIPMFVLADEPTYGADIKNRKNILQKLREFPHIFQLLLITHQDPDLFSKDESITIRKKDNLSYIE